MKNVIIYFPSKFEMTSSISYIFRNGNRAYEMTNSISWILDNDNPVVVTINELTSKYKTNPIGICFESNLDSKPLGKLIHYLLTNIYSFEYKWIDKTKIIIY